MDLKLIGNLIRLRYKLLWAKTRSRSGKIALFMAGYLLLIPLLILFGAGGLGAGAAAVKLGKAERIAQGVLTSMFLSATVTSVILGFGLNAVFSDSELRRYPLRARERFAARHFTGIADPFWLLFLVLYLGLAAGLYLFGAGSLLLGVIAVLMLFVANYLAARIVALLLDRVMRNKSGSVVLPLIIFAVCMLPSMLMPTLQKNKAALGKIVRVLQYSPMFGAGTLMTRTDLSALYGFGLVATWTVGFLALVAAIEKRPVRTRAVQTSRVKWDTPFDQVGGLFGPKYAPLVAHWLRFFLRCNRFRVAYLISIPLIPFLVFMSSHQPKRAAFSPVGIFAIVAFAPVAAMAVNQFGYVGSGFRRYLLLPADPGQTLRASSYTLMLLSVPLIPIGVLGYVAIAPGPVDGRYLLLLAGSSLVGMFLFQGIGLWTTLYGPRRSDYYATMGNDLSLAGNIVVIGGMIACMFGPRALGFNPAPQDWWMMIPLVAAAVVFYFVSLRQADGVLARRRERLLALFEGRS